MSLHVGVVWVCLYKAAHLIKNKTLRSVTTLGQNTISLRNMLMKFIENDSYVILLFDNKTFKL